MYYGWLKEQDAAEGGAGEGGARPSLPTGLPAKAMGAPVDSGSYSEEEDVVGYVALLNVVLMLCVTLHGSPSIT